MTVTVLLSTYNGEKYVKRLIESIACQTYLQDEKSKLILLIRDDASNDNTVEVILNYKEELSIYKNLAIDIIRGTENIGSARSFWELNSISGESDYYAYCDQDDVWLPEKIQNAIDAISQIKKPSLYMGNVLIVNDNLENLPGYVVCNKHFTDFNHSLVFQSSAGCTFVFNRKAMDILREYKMSERNIFHHDWLTHKIIALYGQVVYDDKQLILYRQHCDNTIGATLETKSGFRKVLHFFHDLINNKKIMIEPSISAKYILEAYQGRQQGREEQFKILKLLSEYQHNIFYKIRLLHSSFYNSDFISNIKTKIRILFNRL